jgi:hypothetical protein
MTAAIGSLTLDLGGCRAAAAEPESSLRLLYGNGFDDTFYELNTVDEGMWSVVGRHWRPWDYGDSYVWLAAYAGSFAEFDDPSGRRGRVETYIAWWPRLSLSRATKKDLSWGPIADVYVAAELATGLGSDSTSIGVSLDFSAPGFTYLGMAVYRRDDSVTNPVAQATFWWVRPLRTGRTTVTTEGYLYAAGSDDVGTDFFSIVQVVADIGVFMGQPPNRFHVGVEWYYHDHRDQSVSVPQLILKWDW